MHKVVNVRALFNESRSKELRLSRLQAHQEVEDGDNEIISFMGTRVLWIVKSSHNLVHQPVNRYKFEDRTRYVSHILKLS